MAHQTNDKAHQMVGFFFTSNTNRAENMKKVGIIRCRQTEDLCPGTTDLICASEGKSAFAELGPCTVIGFVSCGGCPGRQAAARAKVLKDRGAEAIFLASCIGKGSPMGFPCPNAEKMLETVRKAVEGVPVYDHTH